jgi:hypothetical protein
VQQVNDKIVDSQAQNGDNQELPVFSRYMRTGALEGPNPVPDVVVGGGKHEAKGVGEVFVPFEFLFAQPSGEKVNHGAGESHHAELQKLPY